MAAQPSAVRRVIVGSMLFVGVAAMGLALWDRPVWLFALTGALAVVTWWMAKCPHPRPLALLPPVVDEIGERQPAQWYCTQCGEQFPARFDHPDMPVVRAHARPAGLSADMRPVADPVHHHRLAG
jgi:hypothetical protein